MVSVKSIALFNHGVAHISRGARFDLSFPLELQFKHYEMNDILKSLIVEDRGDGLVTGLSYETAESIEDKMKTKALVVPPDQSVRQLLTSVVGCMVELTVGDPQQLATTRIFGRVIGIQKENRSTLPPQPAQVVLMLESNDIQIVDLDLVLRLKLLDPSAHLDLSYYLNALISQRRKEMKSVTLFLEGQNHDLEISYISEMAPWRVTYRLFYSPKETMIQCWGIVDNTLDEDLKDIRLTLLSGRPISFIYDLYLAQRLERQRIREEHAISTAPIELEGEKRQLESQDVQLEAMREARKELATEVAQALGRGGPPGAPAAMPPPAPAPAMDALMGASIASGAGYGGGFDGMRAADKGMMAPKMKKRAAEPRKAEMELDMLMEEEEAMYDYDDYGCEECEAEPMPEEPEDMLSDFETMLDMEEPGPDMIEVEIEATAIEDYTQELASTVVTTEAIQLAEVFKYDIASLVTIKRGQSAMVPIVQKAITCTKEAIYNRVKTGKHPVLCMRLENDLGVVFERGPITIVEESTYVGEAILPKLEHSDETRVVYAIATGVTITEKSEAKTSFREITIEKDQVVYAENHDELITYVMENDTLATLGLVIEHPRSSTHKLHEMADPFEVSEEFYKWKLTLEPKREVKFEVKQREVRKTKFRILDRSKYVYRDYLKEEKLSEEQFKFIERVFEAKERVDRYQSYLNTLRTQEQTMANHQRSLNQLIGNLGYDHGHLNIRNRIIDKLAHHEVRLSKLRETILAVRKEERYLSTWLSWLYDPERYPKFKERETVEIPLLRDFINEHTCYEWHSKYSSYVQKGLE